MISQATVMSFQVSFLNSKLYIFNSCCFYFNIFVALFADNIQIGAFLASPKSKFVKKWLDFIVLFVNCTVKAVTATINSFSRI